MYNQICSKQARLLHVQRAISWQKFINQVKDQEKLPSPEESKAAKKLKEEKIEKIEIDEDDPLAEIKSLQKEEIATEAIPVSELKKAKYEKQVPGEFDFEAFDTKGFGEGYSKDKRAEMEKMYSGTVTSVDTGEVVKGIVVGINDRDVILEHRI